MELSGVCEGFTVVLGTGVLPPALLLPPNGAQAGRKSRRIRTGKDHNFNGPREYLCMVLYLLLGRSIGGGRDESAPTVLSRF